VRGRVPGTADSGEVLREGQLTLLRTPRCARRNDKCRMQNAKAKKKPEPRGGSFFYFSFCILHFAFVF
jgi:hypothetical protein